MIMLEIESGLRHTFFSLYLSLSLVLLTRQTRLPVTKWISSARQLILDDASK